MKITKTKQVPKDEVVDVICDCCGKSCMTDYGANCMYMESYWGFASNKDLEHWTAQICESCVDERLSFIKFKNETCLPF